MTLLTATKLAIGSVICTYLLRLLGTVMPRAFRIEQVAAGAAGLHLVCGVALVIFFVLFLTEYTGRSRETMRHVAYWAIAGAFVNPLLSLRALLLIVDPYALGPFLRSHAVSSVAPWVGSILFLIFFVRLRDALRPAERSALQKPTTAAAIGFAVLFVLQTIVLLNFMATGTTQWLSNHAGWLAVGVLPVITAVTLAILAFFFSFHRHLVDSAVRKGRLDPTTMSD